MDNASAGYRVLEYKLARIRDHVNSRLSVLSGDSSAVELKVILKMIEEFEVVPSGWKISKPLVDPSEFDKFVKRGSCVDGKR